MVDVTSRDPSVRRSVALSLRHVNDLPSWILSSIYMFADDTKVWTVIDTDLDCTALQMDIDVLLKWSDQWLLRFNPQKCKVISLGHSTHYNYVMRDATGTFVIERTTEERSRSWNNYNRKLEARQPVC